MCTRRDWAGCPGGELFVTFNSKDSQTYQTEKKGDSPTIYKTEGIEKDIPHSYVDLADIRELMKGFRLLKVQQILDHVYAEKPAQGNHYFVLAAKV